MKAAFDITFILVGPAVPENVGAAARAMKTMGISQLCLVNPCDYRGTKARMLAHGSNDILEKALVFETLGQAVEGIDFIIGTTARKRSKRVDYHPVEQLPEIILSKSGSIRTIGIVFGREESGLTNPEIALCHLLCTIPMATTYPSLNLGQAVMLFSYTLSDLTGWKSPKKVIQKNISSWNVLKTKTEILLPKLGISTDDLIFTRIMERFALLGETDVNLLHSIMAGLEQRDEYN